MKKKYILTHAWHTRAHTHRDVTHTGTKTVWNRLAQMWKRYPKPIWFTGYLNLQNLRICDALWKNIFFLSRMMLWNEWESVIDEWLYNWHKYIFVYCMNWFLCCTQWSTLGGCDFHLCLYNNISQHLSIHILCVFFLYSTFYYLYNAIFHAFVLPSWDKKYFFEKI